MHQAVIYEERSQLDKNLGEFMELDSKTSALELRNWTAYLKQERVVHERSCQYPLCIRTRYVVHFHDFPHLRSNVEKEVQVWAKEHSVLGKTARRPENSCESVHGFVAVEVSLSVISLTTSSICLTYVCFHIGLL